MATSTATTTTTTSSTPTTTTTTAPTTNAPEQEERPSPRQYLPWTGQLATVYHTVCPRNLTHASSVRQVLGHGGGQVNSR